MTDINPQNTERDVALIHDLLKSKMESHVVEFKYNNEDPAKIGKYLSALSNAARLSDKDSAYVLWGVEDVSGEVLGTNFSPFEQKVGNQTLIFKLAQSLTPSIPFNSVR